MGNISYFCIVKRLKRYFRYSLTSLFLFSFCNAFAATDEVGDSIEISLLTCQPHQEVYSLYGHTAIRYRDRRNGTDIAVNYGMFSFRKPFFVLRFIFGLTDYEMGIEPFEDFCAQYASYGSGVRQQTLRLSKQRLEKPLQRITCRKTGYIATTISTITARPEPVIFF